MGKAQEIKKKGGFRALLADTCCSDVTRVRVYTYVYATRNRSGLHFSVEFRQNEKTDITSLRKRRGGPAERIPE